MPRNSSGAYTLPAGNPVVANTLIETAWANPTMSDIAAALTDSLDRYGRGSMLAPMKFADGTAVAPGIAFASEPNTGFYRVGSKVLGVSVNGASVARFSETGLTLLDGTAAAPSFTFTVDTDTGMYRPVADTLGFTVAGVEKMRLETDGKLVISEHLRVGPGPTFVFGIDDTHQYAVWGFTETANLQFAYATDSLTFMRSDVALFTLGATGLSLFEGNAFKPGGGSWVDVSDARVKHGIRDYLAGLAQVLRLRPRTFRFNADTGRDPERVYYGLVAQEAQGVMPELVGRQADGMLTLDPSALVYALCNAVRELHGRILNLEGA